MLILNGPEYEAYREKSSDILKKYFNVSTENYGLMHRDIMKKLWMKQSPEALKQLQDMYENKEISKEMYDEQMKLHDGGPQDPYAYLKNIVVKVKHGLVSY